MDHETNLHRDNEFSPELPVQCASDGQDHTIPTEEEDYLDLLVSAIDSSIADAPAPIPTGEEPQDTCTPIKSEGTYPQQEAEVKNPNIPGIQPGNNYFNYSSPTPYYNYINDPGRKPNTPFSAPMAQNNGTARAMETPYGSPRNPVQNPTGPYQRGYYGMPPYTNPYAAAPNGFYGNNGPYRPYSLPEKKQKKNKRPVTAMILGLIALLVLNYYPLVAFVLGLIALCKAFKGLRAGNIGGGKKFCGILGMILGVFTLATSSAMLIMLMTLAIRVLGQ